MTPEEVGADTLVPLLVDTYMQISQFSADMAYARRTLYEAYLAEGFEPHQALELCKIL